MNNKSIKEFKFYTTGIPDDITQCERCDRQLDLFPKKLYHLAICSNCRKEIILNAALIKGDTL